MWLLLLLGLAMPLPKETVNIPITGGLDSKTGPLVQVPGTFLELTDVRQERTNEWRNRQGITHADALDDLAGAPLRTCELPGGGLFGLSVGGTNGNAGLAYSRNVPSTAARWNNLSTNCSQVRPSHWSSKPVGAETGAAITQSFTTMAVGNGFQLSAWKASGTTIRVVITDTTDGKVVYSANSFGATTCGAPRAVYEDASKFFLVFWVEGANVNVAKWNATTGAFVTSATLKTNALANTSHIDARWYSSANVTVVYEDSSNNAHQLEVTPSSLALATDVDLAISCVSTLALLPDPDGGSTRFVALSNTGPEIRVLRTTTAAAISTNDLVTSADTANNIAGVAYQSGASWMIVYHEPTTFQLKAAKKYSGTVGAVLALSINYGLAVNTAVLASNAWREPGTDAMRYMAGLQLSVYGTGGESQSNYYEMALEYDNSATTISNRYTEPQARVWPLNAAPPATSTLPQVTRTGTLAFALPLTRIASPVFAAGVIAHEFAVEAWQQKILATGDTVNQGVGDTGPTAGYIPAGLLLTSTNGQTIFGHGASALPFKPTCALSAGAGLTADQAVQYVVTDERYDEAGNVWRSDKSLPSASITPTGGNLNVTVTIRLSSFENHNRTRLVKLWRTLGNGSVYQLVAQFTKLCDPTNSMFTFVDAVPDTTLALSNFLPVGLLATITPAFNHIAFFDGRMWGAERDRPNRLRYTRLMQTGVQPEYPGEFFKDIEDEEGPITGISALEDKLIVYKAGAVYFVNAGGPGDDGTGNQYIVTKVSSELGAKEGSPTLSIGSESWFVHDGIYRIKRNLEIEWIGKPVDRWFNQPMLVTPETAISMGYNRRRDEVRVLTGTYRFIFDRTHGTWARDTGTAFSSCAYVQELSDVGDMHLMESGQVWWDYDTEAIGNSEDASGDLTGVIRAPWLRATIEGHIRLWKLRGLYKREPSGTTLNWPITRVYFNEDDSIFEDDAPTGTSGSTKQTIETRTVRMKCSAFSPQITLPSGDLRWRLNGWAALMAVKKALRPARGAALGRPANSTPPMLGLVQWVRGDVGLSVASTRVTEWEDQSGFGQDFTEINASARPYSLGDTVDGIPLVSFGVAGDANKAMVTAANFKNRSGVNMTGQSARTVMAIVKPRFDAAWGITGLQLWGHSDWAAVFDLESTFTSNGAYAFWQAFRNEAQSMQFTPITGGAGGPYDEEPILLEWWSDGAPNLEFRINNVEVALTPDTMPGGGSTSPGAAFLSADGLIAWLGSVAEILVWDVGITAGQRANAVAYLQGRYPSVLT